MVLIITVSLLTTIVFVLQCLMLSNGRYNRKQEDECFMETIKHVTNTYEK